MRYLFAFIFVVGLFVLTSRFVPALIMGMGYGLYVILGLTFLIVAAKVKFSK
jgi:hypothetical protein